MWKFLRSLLGQADYSEFEPDPDDVQAPPPPPASEDAASEEPEGEGFVPEAKAPAVVVERFVRLVLLTKLADAFYLNAMAEQAGRADVAASGSAGCKSVLDQFVALGLQPGTFEPQEEAFLMGVATGQMDPRLMMGAQWRLECAAMLAWALGQPAPSPSQSAELDAVEGLIPADKAAFDAFCASAELRTLPVLMSKRGEVLNQFFPLMISGAGEARSRALERARAMRWLTEPSEAELSSIQM